MDTGRPDGKNESKQVDMLATCVWRTDRLTTVRGTLVVNGISTGSLKRSEYAIWENSLEVLGAVSEGYSF